MADFNIQERLAKMREASDRQVETRSQTTPTIAPQKTKAPRQTAEKIKPNTLWNIMQNSVSDQGNISEVVDSTTGQVISTPNPSRLGSVVKGAVQGTASGFANTGGTLLDILRAYDTAGSSYTRRANQEAENAAHYREMLERGTLDDGTPITASMRQQLEMLASRADSRSTGYRDAAVNQHAPIARATQSVYDTADRLAAQSAQNIAEAKEGLGSVGQFAVDVGVAGTQLAGDALLAALTGGSALVPMAVRGFGSGTQQARQEGATLGQQVAYGAGSAALSVATEKIANVAAPLRRTFGSGVLDNAIAKATGHLGQSAAGQTVLSALSEGGEEVVEALVQPVLQRITYDETALQQYQDPDYLADTIYQGLIGGALGGALGAAGSIGRRSAENVQRRATGAAQTETAPVSTTQAQEAAEGTTGFLEPTLVSRVRQSIPHIQNMNPVAEVTGTEIPRSGKLVDRLSSFVNAIGNKVNRPGFGDVLFSRGRIKSSMIGHGTGPSKIETFAAVPDVIRNGQQIDYQQNWKGRGYDTYTFAAPITYRGQPTYLGVIVTKDSASNRYYLHEVVDANGDVIFRNDESPASTPNGTSALSGDLDTVVDTGDGAGTTPGTVGTVTDGRASQGVPASNITIPSGAENVNSDPLVQILTGGRRLDQSATETPMDGLGVADVGSLNTDYDRLHAQSSQFYPEGGNAARPVDVPTTDFNGNPISRSASTVMGARAIPDDVIPQIEQMIADGQLSYQRNTDQASLDRANQRIQSDGFDGAMEAFRTAVNKGQVSKDITTLGQTLLNTAANNRDGNAVAEILSLYQTISTNTGQAMQAMSILRKLSPESQLYSIRRMVDGLNKKLQEIHKNYQDVQIDPALLTRFTEQTDQAARDAVMQEIYQNVADQVPSTWRDKWNAWRYLSMLGNPRTHIRNIVGNLGFQPLRTIKNGVAAGIEASLEAAGVNIERTKSFGVSPSLYRAAWNDFRNVADILGGSKYDDVSSQINQRRRIFGNKALEAARKGNSAALEFEDVIFKRITYADSLAGFLRANGVTAAQLENGEVNSELLQRARDYAGQEALRATYQDRNAISDRVDRIVRDTGVVGDAIMPFRRTPANILARGLEYSPAGLARGIWDAARNVENGNKTAAQAIDEIAAGLTGSALMGLGAFLFASGLVTTAQGDDKDDKWAELLGHQGYALELPNGTSVTLDWLAPESMPFFMGVELMSSMGEEGMDANAILDSLKAIANPMLEMSMLQSVNDLIDSVQYAEEAPLTAMIPSAIISYFTQAVPTLFGQIERTGEPERMSTYTDKNSWIPTDVQYAIGRASSRLPGIDFFQTPYIDAWGRTEESGDPLVRAINNFLNPAYVSQVDVDAVEEELQRVRDVTGDTSVFPDNAQRYIEYNNQRKDLTAEEYQKYATTLGRTRYNALSDAFNSPYYQSLTDAEKADVISDVYKYANGVAKKSMVSSYEPDKWIQNAQQAESSGIEAGTFIYYRNRLQSLKDSGMNTSEANSALRKELLNDDRLTSAEKTDLDNWIINDLTVIPKDVNVDYSSPETFTITQMSDGAQKRWNNIKNRFGIDAETYQATWKIYQNDDLKADQKRAQMAEYVGGNAAALYKAFGQKMD